MSLATPTPSACRQTTDFPRAFALNTYDATGWIATLDLLARRLLENDPLSLGMR
jgi:hypothetical protein